MSKVVDIVQFKLLTPEELEMKNYLLNVACLNLSKLFRNYLRELYERETKKVS